MSHILVEPILLTLHVGAARADADPDQLARLRAEVPPALRGSYQETGSEVEVRSIIADIMGSDWHPSGEWREQIETLGGVV